MFILEYYFAKKSFAALRDALSNAHSDREYRIRQQYTDGNNISEHLFVFENVVVICCKADL